MANMLKLAPAGANRSILTVEDVEVLFSYKTAVAAFVPGRGYLRTSTYYSGTTTGHINKWINGDSTEVPQEEIDALIRVSAPKNSASGSTRDDVHPESEALADRQAERNYELGG
jgi:hypothetical protein